ncbi:MAG: Smr/MutS family protein [candidate division WOR-3 bacterium]
MFNQEELFNRAARLLEFDRILEDVAFFAQTPLGKELIYKTKPLNSIVELKSEHEILDEVLKLQESWNLKDIYDFRRELSTIADLSTLSPVFYRNILRNMQIFRKIRDFFHNHHTKYPKLSQLTQNLVVNEEFERLIDQTIDEYGEIRSTASEELKIIREKLHDQRALILTKLKKILDSNRRYLQSTEIALKNNRFCLPVKIEYQSNVSGIIHEFSEAQKTIFVEPLELIVEQNHYTKLKTQEKEEERKILKTIAQNCLKIKDKLVHSLEIIGQLDLLFAKKAYILQNNCVRPVVTTYGALKIYGGVNPILKKTKKEIVPLDISLDDNIKVVLISGPNAGGKTVALKTIGILSLMAICGFYIPADPNTQIPFFKKIFVEIGDEQSLENNLSSFSAHLTRINKILNAADEKSLILIDEICSSTDPDEGSALAFAILEALKDKKSLTLATSHFGKLKSLVAQASGMLNAAMEFSNQPTYRLRLGCYGESSAIVICRQLGVSEKILKNAEKYLDKERVQLSKKINELNLEIQKYYKLNSELESAKTTLENTKRDLETKLISLREQLNEEKQKLLKLKQSWLINARRKIEQLIQEIKETQAEKETIKKAKEYIQNELATVSNELVALNHFDSNSDDNFSIGDYVYSKTYKKTGRIIERNRKLYTVAIGNIKIELPPFDLIKAGPPAESYNDDNLDRRTSVKEQFESVLNIRGLNKEEALYLLNKFLDTAYENNITEVKVIHGKGKGILKDLVWEHLKTDKRVKRFSLGESYEGGQGVTKIELKAQI